MNAILLRCTPVLMFLIFGLIACDSSVQVSGARNYVVGQPITIHVSRGSDFIEGQFKIVDARGTVHTPISSLMSYVFIDSKHFSFRIPPLVASGPAVMEIGSTSGPYKVDIHLFRGFVHGDGQGNLYMRSMDDPTRILRRGTIGAGAYQLRLLDEKSRFVAFSSSDGRIDWLSVDNSDTSRFGVVAPSLTIATNTPGVNAKPSDVLVLSSGLVVATDRGIGTLVLNTTGSGTEITFGSWVSQVGAFSALDISADPSKKIVAAGSRGVTDGILLIFPADPFPTQAMDEPIVLSTETTNISDVAVSRSGAYAAAVAPSLNRLFLVEIASRNVVPTNISGCQNPQNVQFVAGDQRVAVLCVDSKSVELFSVAGTTATPYRTLAVGTESKRPISMFYDTSGLLYIALQDGGLQVLDAGSSNPSVSVVDGFDSIIAGSFFVQP